MRSSFHGFYGNSEETIGKVFKCEDTVFIFDTNILLTLYRCEEETRDQFFTIWKKVKDQCWFPHHVCLEYQRNRLTAVKGSRDSLSAIPKKINSTFNDLKKEIFGDTHNKTISRYTNLHGELENLFSEIEKLTTAFNKNSIDARNEKIDFFSNHDVIRDQIDELTNGRIGNPPVSQDSINAINGLGKTRYKYNTGPGYEDAKDKKNEFYSYGNINYDGEYGDYYVWSQILEHVSQNNIENVVYVTNDAKSDFFFKIDGKVRGPNESLITEIKSKGAKEFILQSIDTFLHHANNYLNAEIDDTTISELTNASPLTKTSINNINVMLKSKVKEAIQAALGDSLTIKSQSKVQDLYLHHKQTLEFYLHELDSINEAPVHDFSGAEMATYENYKKDMLSKIAKTKMAIRLLEDILNVKNDDDITDSNDENDSR